jgi:hypothetical protein
VYFDEVRSAVTPDLLGHLCVVGLEDGRVLIRTVEAGITPGRFDLRSDFGLTIRDIAVVWATKVTALIAP